MKRRSKTENINSKRIKPTIDIEKQLPDEIIENIAYYLSLKEFSNFLITNKRINSLLQKNNFWMNLYLYELDDLYLFNQDIIDKTDFKYLLKTKRKYKNNIYPFDYNNNSELNLFELNYLFNKENDNFYLNKFLEQNETMNEKFQ